MFGASKSGSAALPSDPDFEYVTLLLDGNGTNGGQNNTFLDSSTNNFTITRNGNTTQGSFSPYGNLWSNSLFNPNYLTTPANSVFAISGDFTLECWVLSSDSSLDGSTRRRVFHTGGGDIASSLQLLLGTSGGNSAVISVLNNGFLIDGTISVCTGQWVHIAVTRSGTSLKLFVNGVQSGSTATTSQNFNSGTSNTVTIGANSGGGGVWQGYISNMRLITGTALYTSAFTPPTTPLTAISGTQLLTCQSNRFVDNSSNNLTITPTGSPSVQRFSPFNPSAPYDTSVIGGSGYIGTGSTDYLRVAQTTSLDFGSGDFTIEAWQYVTSYGSGTFATIGKWNNAGGTNKEWMLLSYSNQLSLLYSTNGSSQTDLDVSCTLPLNCWNHVAVSRSGSNAYFFVNGALVSTQSISGTLYAANSPVDFPDYTATASAGTGYLADVRVVKGTAVYTAAFTPPTAPLTAITNTQLLTNFTNASIFDYAMMNNLETVGNAQVSTSVKKFGTGSLAFDGTGDYLSTSPNQALNFGTGDFTVEFWLYTTTTTTKFVFSQGGVSIGRNGVVIGFNNSTSFYWLFGNGSSWVFERTPAGTVSTNTWMHIAVVRDSGTARFYVGGVQIDSIANTTNLSQQTSNISYIGGNPDGYVLNGYMDDVRVTNGICRYPSGTTFTPPTAAFPTY